MPPPPSMLGLYDSRVEIHIGSIASYTMYPEPYILILWAAFALAKHFGIITCESQPIEVLCIIKVYGHRLQAYCVTDA